MARITVHAVHADGEPRRWTLSERIVAEHFDSVHYAAQLLERLTWATADAEVLESQPAEVNAELPTRSGADGASQRSGTRPVASGRVTT